MIIKEHREFSKVYREKLSMNNEKNKMGSNRVIIEPNRLIPSYDIYNKQNYLNISQEKEIRKNKKLAIDTIALKALKVMQNSLTDYNIYYKTNYISFSEERKKEKAIMIVKTVRHLPQDDIIPNNNRYINISINDNYVEDGAVVLTVRHSSHKRDSPSREIPGANPGRTASTFENSNKNINKIREVII